MRNNLKLVNYEERNGFKNYFQLYYNCGRFAIVFQNENMDWVAEVKRSDYDRHTFKYRTHAMDYVEFELRIKEELPENYKISRPRYKK